MEMIQIEIPDLEGTAETRAPQEAQAEQPVEIYGAPPSHSEKPAEYALHILFTQFVRHTERKFNSIENHFFDVEQVFGEGKDPQFDKILVSLGHVASRKPKPVIDSVMYWRKSKSESEELKSLASIYILSRVLIEVVKQAELGDDLYAKLEEIVFKQLVSADPLAISRSPVRLANWKLLSKLLGDMSVKNFASVEDRFVYELEKVPQNLTRTQQGKYELLIQAMAHLQLKLYPEERLEESANFLQSVAKFYDATSSTVLKDRYSEVLSALFEPIAAVASAEMNHPLWAKCVQSIHQNSLLLLKRNWQPAFELAVMSLCVAPSDFFMDNFLPLLDSHLAPLRQKINSKWNPRFNAVFENASKLVWVYCFRCTESFNATTKKIETIKRMLFSHKKFSFFEPEAQTACVSTLCSLFHAYQQYTLDEILAPLLGSATDLAPERALIAVQAFTMCLHSLANATTPDFPTREWIASFALPKYVKPEVTISGSLNESIERFGNTLASMLQVLSMQLEHMPEESPSRQNSVTYLVGLTKHSHPVKTLESLVVAIISSMPYWAQQHHWELLCRQINMGGAGSRAVTQALHNLAQTCDLQALIGVYQKYLFSVDAQVFTSRAPTLRFDRTLRTYIDLVETWVKRISGSPWSTVEEIEGNGLFFLCSQDRTIRQMALRILWLSTELDKAIGGTQERLIHFLESTEVASLEAPELSMPERTRLARFRSKKASIARLADSDYGVDSAIWLKLFPKVISRIFERYPMPMALCRSVVCSRLVQMHEVIFEVMEQDIQKGSHAEMIVEQWRIYLVVACTTLTTTDEQKLYVPEIEPPMQHNRKKSGTKLTLHHQRITSARSVFRICLPLLASQNHSVYDAVIVGLSCVNENTYLTLLQCIHPFLGKWGQLSTTYLLQILCNTAHLLDNSDPKVASELRSILDAITNPDPRYFCELVSMSSMIWSVSEKKRYFSLIEKWSVYGRNAAMALEREAALKRAALARAPHDQNIVLASLDFDKRKADYSINKAMACLVGPECDQQAVGLWIQNCVQPLPDIAKLAVENLVKHNALHTETVYRAYQSRAHFLGLVAAMRQVTPTQAPELLALGMFRVGSDDLEIRSQALELISLVEKKCYGRNDFDVYQTRIRSRTPPVFKREIFRVSAVLASALPELTPAIFSCLAHAFQVCDARRDILSAILPWIQNIKFASLDDAAVLCSLFSLTLEFSDMQHEMEALWIALCLNDNTKVVLEFLFRICLVTRSPGVIIFARRILLFLSGSPVERFLVDTLLGYFEPQWLISQTPKPLDFAEFDAVAMATACDRALNLPTQNLPQLSYGHLALVFLVDLTDSTELLRPALARILHVCLVLTDYFVPLVQEKAVELTHHMLAMFSEGGSAQTEALLKSLGPLKWYYDDMNLTSRSAGNVTTPENMRKLIATVTSALGPLGVGEDWSREAIKWATTCPIRHIACRSFQVFRCVLVDADKSMLADMLARLSTTISEDAADIQGFSIQILMTINAIVDRTPETYPQLFWGTVAALGTTKEREYIECLSVMAKILTKFDWSEPSVEVLWNHFPQRWEGDFQGVQNLVLLGLRSSNAMDLSLDLLCALCAHHNNILFDQHWLGQTFAAFLPIFLHALEVGDLERTSTYAVTLEELARVHGLNSFERILHSLSRGRFRSKRDFLSQYVNALCDFGSDLYAVLMLFMGALSNKHEWVRVEVLGVLKLLLPSIDLSDNRIRGVGADIVSPLLRLLQTDLVEQALEVLDEASSLVAGQMDKHILRMSLGSRTLIKEYERTATLFGIPEESGWSVPKPAIQATVARNNVHSVFYTCNESEAVDFQFEGEEEVPELHRVESFRSMDRMLSALDDLDTFFNHRKQNSLTSWVHSRKPSGQSAFSDLDPPHLYDKKVSLILNHSLADQSSVSFRTSFADPFPIVEEELEPVSSAGSNSTVADSSFRLESLLRGKRKKKEKKQEVFQFP